MNVVQEIATWAKERPKWQSDAVRRIFTQDSLSAEDEDEILMMLLSENGIKEDERTVPVAVPFSEVVTTTSGVSRQIVLKEIHSLAGVNALVSDQSIAFALDGLTVIYGENGAGKSGYARVFKHACHARDRGDPILSDVGSTKKEKAKAIIELSVDDVDVAIEWTAGTPTNELLAEVAVFDSQCARVFLDEANEVVYLPYGMDVFGRLAALCTSLKNKIQSRSTSLPFSFGPAAKFAESTNAGRLVRALNDKTDVEKLGALAKFNEKEVARLHELRRVVAEIRANPPRERASQLRRTKTRFDQLRAKIAAIEEQLSAVSIKTLEQCSSTAIAAAKAAKLASTEAFTSDPVGGIGSDPWRLLFEAARTYSEKVAFPGEEFPVIREGAFCVLCQQDLTPEGADRLTRFQTFVMENAATKKVQAETNLAAALSRISQVNTQLFVADKTLIEELRAHSESLGAGVEKYLIAAESRKSAAIKAAGNGIWNAIPVMPASIVTGLKDAVDLVEGTAKTFDSADDPEKLKNLQAELAELTDRENLSVHLDDIKTYILQRKKATALRACEKSLDTTAITKAGTDLMERVVTEQMVNALDRELRFFDVKCVPLTLSQKGQKGKTKHQLTIESGARPSGVLSEGEQRVVAIASFLAELETSSSSLPIIFDDPVSSLDHIFRERVAKRLVREAKNRQVVVFTHDIVMLLALERECGEQETKLLGHTIRRSAAGPGECPEGGSRPWQASSTKDRIGILKQAIAPFKKMAVESPSEYAAAASEVYGKLRETWERAIEEVLLNDAIQRFRPSVETQRLKKVVIESGDYAIIEKAMGKCSALLNGHDSAPALHQPVPQPAELQQDVETVEAFVKSIRKRWETAEQAANALIDAPKATTSNTRASNVVRTSAVA